MKLSEVATATTALKDTDSVLVTVGTSVKRISIENFRTVINSSDTQLLNTTAWGFTLNSSTSTGMITPTIVGSTALRKAYLAEVGRYQISRTAAKAAKLMSTDSSKFANGNTVTSTNGDIFVRLPKLYYKVVTSGTKTTIWMSQNPIGGHYFEESYVGAYLGLISSSKLRSVESQTPTRSKTLSDYMTAAKANGTDYGVMSYDQWRHICFLLLANYKDLAATKQTINVQTLIGYGVTGSDSINDTTTNNNAIAQSKTGATKTLGDATGKVDVSYNQSSGSAVSNTCHVSLFGIEDLWGCFGQLIQGVYTGSSSNSGQDGTEVFVYQGNRVPSAAELASVPSGDYRQTTRLLNGGYISNMVLGEYGDLIANALDGSGSTFVPDYQDNIDGQQYIAIGGYIGANASCGLFCYNSTSSAATYGSRMSYFGKPKIVDSL